MRSVRAAGNPSAPPRASRDYRPRTVATPSFANTSVRRAPREERAKAFVSSSTGPRNAKAPTGSANRGLESGVAEGLPVANPSKRKGSAHRERERVGRMNDAPTQRGSRHARAFGLE